MAVRKKKETDFKVRFDESTIADFKELAPSIGVSTDSNQDIVMGTLRKAIKLLKEAAKSDNITLERGGDTYKVKLKN